MKSPFFLLFVCVSAIFATVPALADNASFIETTVTVEEEWLDEDVSPFSIDLDLPRRELGAAVADFGVFRVLNQTTVELTGTIGSETPRDFATILRAFPGITMLQITDCAGTDDDEANFTLARMIRARGMTTYVPSYGSARSGGVELFLAGARRRADTGASFAVHSWRDEDGYEAADFAMSDPVHQDYIRFYRDMGMTDANAKAFYQMTNSVGFDDVLWLTKTDLARFIAVE